MSGKTFYPLLASATLLLASACADPAANAPQAEVSAPTPTPPPAAEASPKTTGTVFALAETSTIGFVGSKVTGSHEGGFTAFEGSVTLQDTSPENAQVSVRIDTTSLWSDTDNLTGHLTGPDFFDVASHPAATFESTSIAPAADGLYTVTGNLDLHGVIKQISFPATISLNADGFVATAEFAIKRFDFGIAYKGKADDLIRDDVLIKLDLRSAAST